MEDNTLISIEELMKKRKQILKKIQKDQKSTSVLGRFAIWITE
jgi:hypothetical protein